MPAMRVAFVSYHAAFDPSNGAARTMRDMMRMLARAGCETWSLTGACVDRPDERARSVALAALGGEGRAHEEDGALILTNDRGTPSLLFVPDVPNGPQPEPAERDAFLEHARRLLGAMRPDVVLTYGGGAMGRQVIAEAKTGGAAVVFRIMNFRYRRKDLFDGVDGVLVPARYVGDIYQRGLGIETHAIPCPLDASATVVPTPLRAPRTLTYVAPCPDKGLSWAARILDELAIKRPDIPLLVVEGRGRLDALAAAVSPEARARIQAVRTVPDPRSFLAGTRVLLMPSYVEPSGRLAQEAVLNGIPVVASAIGGLVETLAEAGILLPIPPRFAEQGNAPPPAAVTDWLAAIERLFDDEAHYEAEARRCETARARWDEDRLANEYLRFLEALRASGSGTQPALAASLAVLDRARSLPSGRDAEPGSASAIAPLRTFPLADASD